MNWCGDCGRCAPIPAEGVPGVSRFLTDRQLAVLFDVSQKQVDRVRHDLVRLLGELVAPAPTDRRELWIVDGTLIPTWATRGLRYARITADR